MGVKGSDIRHRSIKNTDMNDNTEIRLDSGKTATAQCPVIISASRSTDIPAFYSEWFFNRLKKGYSAWTNPYNSSKIHISYKRTKFIVFWSKNPKPLLGHIDTLDELGIGCYIQYTLNDYGEEGLEKGVPPLSQRIDTFRMLVDRLGKGRVIWRFDPLILTDRIDADLLLRKIEAVGDALNGYSEKLVFSFADIVSYRRVKSNLELNGIRYNDWAEEMMRGFARELSMLNKKWGYELATCGERVDLSEYGIQKNHCIDDRLIVRFGHRSKELMEYLGARYIQPSLFGTDTPENAIPLDGGGLAVITHDNRDRGQREVCGCMKSKDIGEYSTCPHLCEYCYANSSKECALRNWRLHRQNPDAETITGR